LKILAGAHDATSGIGLVSGFDVSSERIKVFESLGNCPQFDVIWPKMTVKEHLTFFAKLKGLPRPDIPNACLNIATAVGLGTDVVYNRNAGALSGGMRRRLSIAISLVGAPSVFVLDEPTTGNAIRGCVWYSTESCLNNVFIFFSSLLQV
jgi:ABC-type multidrug transport system ATPase subunit